MEQFSEEVNFILKEKSREVAKRFRTCLIQPEHLALAILERRDPVTSLILSQMEVSADAVQAIMEELIERGTDVCKGNCTFSESTENVLLQARQEAHTLGSLVVKPEHLFLATMIEPESRVQRCMEKFGVVIDSFRIVLTEYTLTRNQQKVKKDIAQTIKEEVLKSLGQQIEQEHQDGKPQPERPTNSLNLYCQDLTALAEDGKISSIIGREKEIQRLLRILCRKVKNNPALIGEAGVGKTAVVEGAALRIAQGKAPRFFANKRIYSLDLTSLVAGSRYRGEFEERIKTLIHDLKKHPNAILFIDELHTIVGAGDGDGALDASNILKPALSRSEIQVIGATTLKEYRRFIERDSALERRFQTVLVEEPSKEETLLILRGIKSQYETMHHIEYTDQALYAAIELSCRYLTERKLPDKAIDLIDEAGAQKRLERYEIPAQLDEMESRFTFLEQEVTNCINNNQAERAYLLQEEMDRLFTKIQDLRQNHQQVMESPKELVTHHDIEKIISEITGVPEKSIHQSHAQKILDLEKTLKEQVIGQDEAISSICSAIRRNYAGLSSLERPVASFLFVGSTGVGKTLLAKKLALNLFNREDALIRIDMSEYSEKHNVARLVGAPPGYVGYEEGGVLTEKVRRRPYSVVLFDEIEKAHPEVFNMLLQVLDDGRLEDGLGRSVSFKNSIIIMTSNAGTQHILKEPLGFLRENTMDQKALRRSAEADLKKLFLPEFLNRIDEIIHFQLLTPLEIGRILDIELGKITNNLIKEKAITLTISDSARDLLCHEAFNAHFGARSLRRTLVKDLEEPLAIEILKVMKVPAELKVEALDNKIIIKAC